MRRHGDGKGDLYWNGWGLACLHRHYHSLPHLKGVRLITLERSPSALALAGLTLQVQGYWVWREELGRSGSEVQPELRPQLCAISGLGFRSSSSSSCWWFLGPCQRELVLEFIMDCKLCSWTLLHASLFQLHPFLFFMPQLGSSWGRRMLRSTGRTYSCGTNSVSTSSKVN